MFFNQEDILQNQLNKRKSILAGFGITENIENPNLKKGSDSTLGKGEHWVTINGKHVLLGGNGEVKSGNLGPVKKVGGEEKKGKGMPTYNKETNQYKSGRENDEMREDNDDGGYKNGQRFPGDKESGGDSQVSKKLSGIKHKGKKVIVSSFSDKNDGSIIKQKGIITGVHGDEDNSFIRVKVEGKDKDEPFLKDNVSLNES